MKRVNKGHTSTQKEEECHQDERFCTDCIMLQRSETTANSIVLLITITIFTIINYLRNLSAELCEELYLA